MGYVDDDQRIEYSCVLREGQHIHGWEVFALRQLVESGRTPDGKEPIASVRVVFREESMARCEMRPLLDIGCKVFFHGTDGEKHEIVE